MGRVVNLARRFVLAGVALATAASFAVAQPTPPVSVQRSASRLTPPPDPVVVELYTAQGCAACNGALEWANRLADRRSVILLTFPVDYWDYLGWKDTFAHPAFGARQRAHKQRLGLKDVYTPQVVIDGRRETDGLSMSRAMRLVGEMPPKLGLEVEFEDQGRRVFVTGAGPPNGGAEVWLVRYDPQQLTVPVTSGENQGADVVHRNVVRELVRLGPWTGRARSYSLPTATSARLRTVVIVQSIRGRQGVLAVARR